ncbi:MAG: ribosome maturation factor RimM [Clostridia bacterium]|nr:ribosome maturation factor RimM [Clostridia bacterium]
MDYLRIALIARPHGVQGSVKLLPLSEDMNRYHGLKEAYLERNGQYQPITLSDVGVQPDAVYARLSCCPDRNTAETLRNLYICVDRVNAIKLPEGRYFISDIIGCAVTDTEGKQYGKLTDVLETGANDVYVIKGDKTLMVPALKKLLSSVDIQAKAIVLDAAVLEEVGLFED